MNDDLVGFERRLLEAAQLNNVDTAVGLITDYYRDDVLNAKQLRIIQLRMRSLGYGPFIDRVLSDAMERIAKIMLHNGEDYSIFVDTFPRIDHTRSLFLSVIQHDDVEKVHRYFVRLKQESINHRGYREYWVEALMRANCTSGTRLGLIAELTIRYERYSLLRYLASDYQSSVGYRYSIDVALALLRATDNESMTEIAAILDNKTSMKAEIGSERLSILIHVLDVEY